MHDATPPNPIRGAASLALCLLCCGCGPAPADGPSPASPPPASGPIEFVGDVALVPQRGQIGTGRGLGVNGHHVLFLNFEGVDIRYGQPGDPFDNTGLRATDMRGNPTPDTPVVQIDPYDPGGMSRYKDILQVQKYLAGWYKDMNLDVVISRPLTGDYTMAIVGGHQSDIGLPDGVVGVAPGNCKHGTESVTVYDFAASLGSGLREVAIDAAHESGHAFGLAHTDDDSDIMYPSVSPNVTGFTGGTIPDRSGSCPDQGLGAMQDSYQTLIDNLGARDPRKPSPGGTPPTVHFLDPKDLVDAPSGTMTGSDLSVAVSAQADKGIDHITLSISKVEGGKVRGNHPVAELRPPQSAARVRLSTAGDYLLLATAYDRAGSIALAQSRITVATPTCGGPDDCTPGQKCEGGTCVTPPAPAPPDGMSMSGAGTRASGDACNSSAECGPNDVGIGGTCAITPVGQLCTDYCNSDRPCGGQLGCVDGVCLPPLFMTTQPKFGQLGATCTRGNDCNTGECSAKSPNDPSAPQYCTKVCDPDVAWACPAGMTCTLTAGETGMKNRCVQIAPMPAGQTGGCQASGPGGTGTPGVVWVAALLLLLLRRRGHAS